VGDRNAEVLVGIDWGVVDADFIVQMGTGAATAKAYVSNDFAPVYVLS
jgi:hypothetical protein